MLILALLLSSTQCYSAQYQRYLNVIGRYVSGENITGQLPGESLAELTALNSLHVMAAPGGSLQTVSSATVSFGLCLSVRLTAKYVMRPSCNSSILMYRWTLARHTLSCCWGNLTCKLASLRACRSTTAGKGQMCKQLYFHRKLSVTELTFKNRVQHTAFDQGDKAFTRNQKMHPCLQGFLGHCLLIGQGHSQTFICFRYTRQVSLAAFQPHGVAQAPFPT